MAEIKTCDGCKYLKDMRCSNKEGHYFRGFQCSKYAPQNSKEIIAEQLSEIAENLYREAETVPVVTEQAETEHDAEKESKKSICNNCFWWNKTCHNKKSCCYGDYKDYNGFCGWFEPANAETHQEPQHDAVNHPEHYTQGGIECIDCIKAALGENFIGFLMGNVIKYSYRYKDKNGAEDLKKARWYLDRAIKEVEQNDER